MPNCCMRRCKMCLSVFSADAAQRERPVVCCALRLRGVSGLSPIGPRRANLHADSYRPAEGPASTPGKWTLYPAMTYILF
jgi:hypothetical protein